MIKKHNILTASILFSILHLIFAIASSNMRSKHHCLVDWLTAHDLALNSQNPKCLQASAELAIPFTVTFWDKLKHLQNPHQQKKNKKQKTRNYLL